MAIKPNTLCVTPPSTSGELAPVELHLLPWLGLIAAHCMPSTSGRAQGMHPGFELTEPARIALRFEPLKHGDTVVQVVSPRTQRRIWSLNVSSLVVRTGRGPVFGWEALGDARRWPSEALVGGARTVWRIYASHRHGDRVHLSREAEPQ